LGFGFDLDFDFGGTTVTSSAEESSEWAMVDRVQEGRWRWWKVVEDDNRPGWVCTLCGEGWRARWSVRWKVTSPKFVEFCTWTGTCPNLSQVSWKGWLGMWKDHRKWFLVGKMWYYHIRGKRWKKSFYKHSVISRMLVNNISNAFHRMRFFELQNSISCEKSLKWTGPNSAPSKNTTPHSSSHHIPPHHPFYISLHPPTNHQSQSLSISRPDFFWFHDLTFFDFKTWFLWFSTLGCFLFQDSVVYHFKIQFFHFNSLSYHLKTRFLISGHSFFLLQALVSFDFKTQSLLISRLNLFWFQDLIFFDFKSRLFFYVKTRSFVISGYSFLSSQASVCFYFKIQLHFIW
jgi:hypothetical protein